MSLVIPDDILHAARMSPAELQGEIALLLFQQQKLTLGQASTFAGMSQLEFQRLLTSRQLPLHSAPQEFAPDVGPGLQEANDVITTPQTSEVSAPPTRPLTGHELMEKLYREGMILNMPTRRPLTPEEEAERERLAQVFAVGKPLSEIVIEEREAR